MARILLGWELGGNRGHSVPLKALAKALQADGHEIVIAAQQPAQFVDLEEVTVLQAPIWPGLIGAAPAPGPIPPVNMADILMGLGLSVPGALTSLIRAWDAILRQVRPDVVIADYAPALCCATRGRVRTMSYGTGFCQPPAEMDEFPDLLRLSHHADPVPLLDIVNNELVQAGRSKVTSPPAIFETDDAVVACFAEFDPYRRRRKGGYALPHMAPLAPLYDAPGAEIFVYFHRADGSATKLWDALATTGLKTRVFIAQADRSSYPELSDRGFIIEPTPLPWDLIAKRSRMVISHGGLGFTSGALAMGLPHVVVPHDLEKIVTALTVRRLGIGECVMASELPDVISDHVKAVFENALFGETTRVASTVIRDRIARHAGRDDLWIIRRLVSGQEGQAMVKVARAAA
jgi:rhamnosyltransferase subunit B